MKIAIAAYCLVVGIVLVGLTLRAELEQERTYHQHASSPTLVIRKDQDKRT